METLEESSQHMNALVNDMLDFSKIKENKLVLKQKAFNLHETIENAFQMLQIRFNEKEVESELILSKDFPKHVVGDKQRIVQVMINVIGNAFKFTPKGFITVRCSVRQQTDEYAYCQIVVEDTGIGMNSETIENIYDPYFQADNNLENTGSGLGLNIVKSLVEMHKGSIDCHSVPGQGTTFTLIMKMEIDRDKLADSTEDLNQIAIDEWKNSRTNPLKLMIVDDNFFNLILLDKLLEKYFGDSAERHKAGSADECLTMLQKEKFDVVLMDIQMPNKNGIQATMEIRNELNINKKELAIIALTANMGEAEYIQKCLDAGMNDFLSKPFKNEELIRKILKNSSQS